MPSLQRCERVRKWGGVSDPADCQRIGDLFQRCHDLGQHLRHRKERQCLTGHEGKGTHRAKAVPHRTRAGIEERTQVDLDWPYQQRRSTSAGTARCCAGRAGGWWHRDGGGGVQHGRIFQDPIMSHKCMSKMAAKTSKDTHKSAAELGTP